MAKPKDLVVTHKMLWNECYLAGVVCTGCFTCFTLEAFDDSRDALFDASFGRKNWSAGLGTHAVDLSMVHVKSLCSEDEISICIRVSRNRQKTLDLTSKAYVSDRQLRFTADPGIICVVSSDLKPTDLPEESMLALT